MINLLFDACLRGTAAVRMEVGLQPTSPIEKVFPPTYPPARDTQNNGPTYAYEQRRLEDGTIVNTVLLDSIQSQANRMELALLAARRHGDIRLPLVQVELPYFGTITHLETPHRIYDAIFRDSLLDGEPFFESQLGRRLTLANERNATPLYQHAPTVLIFGGWHSHAGHAEKAPRFARAITAEIVGLNPQQGVKTQSRIDPLGIVKNTATIYRDRDTKKWSLSQETFPEGAKIEKVDPSVIGHGNVAPSVESAGGVSIERAIQTVVISIARLRQLSFPDEQGNTTPERDAAARMVLLTLALYAVAAQVEEGYQLRSRCLLIPESQPVWELVGPTTANRMRFELDVPTAQQLVEEALLKAESYGLVWEDEPITLQPSEDFRKLVELNAALIKHVE